MRKLALLWLLVPLVSCGSGNGDSKGSPVAPTPQIPNVVGSYSGNTTVTVPQLGEQLTCPTTTSVTQSGTTVNIGPIVLGGECDDMSVPFGAVTIDQTGTIQGPNSVTFEEPSCGRYSVVVSGGFVGRELRLTANATSSTCPNITMTIMLTR